MDAPIFLAQLFLKPRFKIDVVIMIICSIVIIINSVLTLQVLTASLPHDREPCEIKVVSNHTCSLHTRVCAGSRRERVRLSGPLSKGRDKNFEEIVKNGFKNTGQTAKKCMIM